MQACNEIHGQGYGARRAHLIDGGTKGTKGHLVLRAPMRLTASMKDL